MIDIDTAKIYLDENNFLRVLLKGKVEMDLKYAKQHEEAIITECKGIPRAFIVEGIGEHNFSRFLPEAHEYLAKSPKINKFRLLEVILVNNLANRLTANAYIKTNQPNCTVKIFNAKEEQKAIQYVKDELTKMGYNP